MPDFPLSCPFCKGYGSVTNEKVPRPWNDYLVECVEAKTQGSSLITKEPCPRCLGGGGAIVVTVIDDNTIDVDPPEFDLFFDIVHGVLVGPSMLTRASDMASVNVTVRKSLEEIPDED